MTTSFIQEYIPVRMREMGFGRRFRTLMRTKYIGGGATLTLNAWNVWVYFPYELLATAPNITVESNFAFMDLSAGKHNEQGFEHTGKITITNRDAGPAVVSFLMAVPDYRDRSRTS